ncbi:MAG: flagellar M-ring protein FliF [Alphaproteobacteria bacterium]|nr:MAG: flagellar M-ring protein FliF [Alphaproteobacteria bacterium]
MRNAVDNLLSLGKRRLTILGAVAAGMLVTLMVGLSAVTAPDQAPLFRNLSQSSSFSIETALVNAGFDARVSEDGTTVTVPRKDLARARMVLAETGLPVDGEPGWELFDGSTGLAMNSFMQRINRLRAMEGELARSILTLDKVQSARVHLVLPEREAFSLDRPEPRASVIVRPTPGATIERQKALAIRNLVASAVPELKLGNVTVLSASGEVILAEDHEGAGQATIQSRQTAIEDRLAQQIRDILTARVGAGNARVRVNVELSTARETVIQQTFDPDQQVVRSTESRNESRVNSETRGNVGVENNIPSALSGTTDPGTTSNQRKVGEKVDFEIGNTRREVVREAGEIKRITVAALVNGIYSANGNDVTYSERSPEELKRLAELVKTAIGYDAARGDQVSVDSMRFMDYSMELGETPTKSIGAQIADNIVSIVRGILALAIVAIALILGVRPTLRLIKETPPPALPPNEAAPKIEDGSQLHAAAKGGALPTATDGQEILPAEPDTMMPGITSVFDPTKDHGPHEYVETLGVRGNLIKARVDAIRGLADEKPDEVLRVLRSWLRAEVDA